MKENRRFLRVNYLGTGWLHHNKARYNCRLENISEKGALVSLKKAPDGLILAGDNCILMLDKEDKKQRYQEYDARIVRFETEMAALEFTETGTRSFDLLDNLIRKELQFTNGSQKLIDLVHEVAEKGGVGLTTAYFDKGEIDPEREMHTLRLSVGEQSINVHLLREEIEAYYARNDTEHVMAKINHAIERLIAYSRENCH
ncbi:MAG: PilZ domain-containing protein [Desulfuromonadaceae bacterium]|nr:PilZ domain-containing protein [Desulfuromonadaceae bacterium]